MRGHQCEGCAYAAKKGEPVFSDCKNCTPDKCDKCGDPLGSAYFSTGGKDYHSQCFPPLQMKGNKDAD